VVIKGQWPPADETRRSHRPIFNRPWTGEVLSPPGKNRPRHALGRGGICGEAPVVTLLPTVTYVICLFR